MKKQQRCALAKLHLPSAKIISIGLLATNDPRMSGSYLDNCKKRCHEKSSIEESPTVEKS